MSEKVGEIHYEVSMDTKEAINESRRLQKNLDEAGRSFESLGAKSTAAANAVSAFVSALAIAATIQKIVAETRKAEQEQAQLVAVLRSTGEGAGWTAEQLNLMADAMSRSSTFGAGDITQAITRMLSYENVVGEQVPKAMQATIDMAARLGTSITHSAEEIGKALNKPSEGMTSLGRKGFEFSADQIALAKKLEATGKMAEAQAIVLEALEFAYGGAAAAARNTFGGAISALQEQLNDLLTADGRSVGSATKAVNDLTTVLGRSETKAAFDAITGWVVDFARVVVTATTNLASFITSGEKLALLIGTDTMSRASTEAQKYSRLLTNLTNKAIQMQEEIDIYTADDIKAGVDPRTDPSIQRKQSALDALRSQIDEVQKKAQSASQTVKDLASGGAKPGESPAISSPSKALDATGAKARADADAKAAKKAEQERERQKQHAKDYLKTLDQQASRVDDMTVSQRLQYDLKTGAVVLQGKELEKATELAKAIDAMKKAQEDRVIAMNQTNAQLSAERDLLAQIDNYSQNIAGMTMSDRAVQDMQARIQITETYLSRIRDLEAQERQALATNQDSSKEASIRKQYADLIAVQQEYQTKSLAEWEKYVLARNAKEGDWTMGAQKAYANYVESARNASAQAQSLFEKGFQTMEDAAVSMAMNTKVSFSDMARSIIADIIRIQIRAAATGGGGGGLLGSLFSAGMSLLGGGTPVGGVGNAGYGDYSSAGLATAFGGKRENGGGVSAGRMYEVNERGKPELLTVGNKQMLMMAGQSGTVTPLGDGRMNVANVPAPATSVAVQFQVEVNNYGGGEVQQKRESQKMPDGRVLEKLVLDIVGESFASGSGAAYRSAKQRFNLRD